MIKKTVTYFDFNGVEQTDTHYFHLTEADVTLYEHSRPGGIHQHLINITKEEDLGAIAREFKTIVDLAYGVRSENGRLFTKTPEALLEFQSSGAYSAIYMELATNEQSAIDFVKGIMPKERQDHKKPEEPLKEISADEVLAG